MHVVFSNVARCLHLTDAVGFNIWRWVAVTHWMRPSLILPSQLFADRYAGPLPIAKMLKGYGVIIKSVVVQARQMTKSHHRRVWNRELTENRWNHLLRWVGPGTRTNG